MLYYVSLVHTMLFSDCQIGKTAKSKTKEVKMVAVRRSFAQVRRSVPEIHVWSDGRPKSFIKAGVFKLVPGCDDGRKENRIWGREIIDGDGSREDPYRPNIPHHESPHFSIIMLWYIFRDQIADGKQIFISVNGLVLEVVSDGVKAEDGQITRFED